MINNNTMTMNDKELIIKDGSIAILNKEGKKVFETDIKGDITINYNDCVWGYKENIINGTKTRQIIIDEIK